MLDLTGIGIPEFLGETITDLFVRGGRGRWQRVASGDRKRAEATVRSLRRNGVSAWVRPAEGSAYEVLVRSTQSEIARALLRAPGSGQAS